MAKFRCLSTRMVLAILGSFGMGILYGLRTNVHFAIVTMVNHTAVREQHTSGQAKGICGGFNETEQPEDGPFNWDAGIQGHLLSAYFWGYMILQFPGGRVAEVFSAKWTFFFSVVSNIACCLLIPVMAYIHYGALLAVRFLQGLTAGPCFPTINCLVSRWSPPNERSTMCSIIYSGSCLGIVIFSVFCGEIAKHLGWEYIFYIEGVFSCMWLIIWGILVADSPDKSRFISDEERDFLISTLAQAGSTKKKRKIPWKHIWRSKAFWSIFISNICSNWGWYMLLTQAPTYFKMVLDFPIRANAIFTAIPYFCMFFFTLILSKTLDVLLTKKKIKIIHVRKISTLFASAVPMVCLIGLCYVGCNRPLAVVLLSIGIMCIGGMFSGFLINQIDIAPNFAGSITGITNCAGTFGGIVAPIFVGQLTKWDPSIRSWHIIFWFSVCLYIIEIVVYMWWGKGEPEPWNDLDSTTEEQAPKTT